MVLSYYSPIYTLFEEFSRNYYHDKARKLSEMLCKIVEKSHYIKLTSDIDTIYRSEPTVFELLYSNGYTESDALLFHDAMNEVELEKD